MTPERWHQIERLLQAALEREPAERAALLERECTRDPSLREEVESLLASASPAHSFLKGNALENATVLLDDADSGSLIGHQVGPYSIQKQLGFGGMGEVYLAQDVRLGRRVALKLLDRSLIGDRQLRSRFIREARTASALDHPNTCTIHEIGEADGLLFIAMQYIEGETLKQVIAGRPLKLDRLVSISLQVANALAAAHAHGIIHRDIKSSNIIIASRGQAKLLDFGIARLVEKHDAAEGELTRTGAVMGTPTYMSPEQARGERTDHRSDIFSFGVVMFEMATGRTPFKGKSQAETMNAVINQAHTPVVTLNRDVPTALSAVIERALAKQPGDRYQSITAMVADLRRVAAQTGILDQLLSSSEAMDGLIAPYVPQRQTFAGTMRRWIESPVRRVAATIVVGVILIALALVVYYLPRRQQQARSALTQPQIKSIAVLPFKPLVTANRDESLEMGMADTLITRLSNIREIDVRPISAVRKYAALDQDTVAAGREQKVDAVLDGSIQKSGERIRITVRLVSVGDGATLWTETFEDKFTDIFTVEDSISERVAGTLAVRLTGEERALVAQHYTNNTDAYQLYLKGRYFRNKSTGEAIEKSIDYLNQAIEKDPKYALAYAGLAASYKLLSNYNVTTPQEAYSKARSAATEALRLDDKLAEAHTAMASIKSQYDWDFAGAGREYKRAIELNPNYAPARDGYGEYLGLTGHPTEGIAELRRALELEPLSLSHNTTLGTLLYFAGRFDESIDQLRKTVELDPGYLRTHIELGYAYRQKRQYEEAMSEFKKALEIDRDDSYALSQLAHTYGIIGRRDEAYKAIAQLKALSRRKYVLPSDIAAIYAGLGEKDRAFEWLEKAYTDRDDGVPFLKVDPSWDSLRSDPRFADLLRRIGFPQ